MERGGTLAEISQFTHYGNYLILEAVVLARLERERMSRVRKPTKDTMLFKRNYSSKESV